MQNVSKEITEKAKKMAEEDYDLIANIINKTGSNKQKYIESRVEYYVKKLTGKK